MPQDIKKSQIYAAKKITFEQEEVAEIKRFDKPGQFKLKSDQFKVRPGQVPGKTRSSEM